MSKTTPSKPRFRATRRAKSSIPGASKNVRNLPIPEMQDWEQAGFWMRAGRSADEDACWLWTGATCGPGYGRLKIGGRVYSAHRVAYELANGAIPPTPGHHGALVMHSCDNPRCCNPRHLKLGTSRENARDMAAKGRNFCPNGRGSGTLERGRQIPALTGNAPAPPNDACRP